jgi:hypothetical protein
MNSAWAGNAFLRKEPPFFLSSFQGLVTRLKIGNLERDASIVVLNANPTMYREGRGRSASPRTIRASLVTRSRLYSRAYLLRLLWVFRILVGKATQP